LALGALENYIWRWLDAGPELAPLLQGLSADGETPQVFLPYLDSLPDACRCVYGEAMQNQ